MHYLYVFLVSAVIMLFSCSSKNNHAMYNKKTDTATLGAGCFWCVEAVFNDVKGVVDVYSGYSGGHVKNPSYKEVCNKNTGHAEVVRVVYDPDTVSFRQLLDVFFHTHDPTTLNRQGNDTGPQYRSVIFYHNHEQKKIAAEVKNEVDRSGEYKDPVVTEISPLINFYKAENYHQDYYEMNKSQPYCRYVIEPKVQKFKIRFKDLSE